MYKLGNKAIVSHMYCYETDISPWIFSSLISRQTIRRMFMWIQALPVKRHKMMNEDRYLDLIKMLSTIIVSKFWVVDRLSWLMSFLYNTCPTTFILALNENLWNNCFSRSTWKKSSTNLQVKNISGQPFVVILAVHTCNVFWHQFSELCLFYRLLFGCYYQLKMGRF